MVKTPVRIGVTGAHSTGKTVLLRRIERELRAEGVRVARTGRLGRRAADIGLPKMHEHTALSTEWIMTQGIADEIAAAAQGADVVMADRAVIDALAYWHAAVEFRGESLDPAQDERLRLLAGTQHAQYHLLLATVLDPDVPVENRRHTYDPRYRELVDHHVHALLAQERIDHRRVVHDPHDEGEAVVAAVRVALGRVPT
ncbi:AAA family ATPase [Actinacidiphila sp. DG2A-62]|uniref:AAA family ATPase n=1 Tax=Actinacidiphila sp. DG2A-62 TaxID=3108821 RepID=UPI002DBE2203|nr:AAA family ATPase [Actinacidiphila sp. DG2A-62]MEC3995359.1 AAA family ATPase [Actinacidiphila sp. DG2A-62]